MKAPLWALIALSTLLVVVSVTAQTSTQVSGSAPTPRVDFGRDVRPILQAQCISCHGPSQQMNGFRLDRRSSAIRGGTFPVITPFNSEGSRFYLKLVGRGFGQQMPPTGKLADAEIEILKRWLDQGAEWPDEFAGEETPRPVVPAATRIMNALRTGDRPGFERALAAGGGKEIGAAGGWTPLMFAALYGDANAVAKLIAVGADANVATDTGTTALMLAVDDAEKVRALLQAGANPNARPEDGRTPLIIAAGRSGASASVKLLLEAKADPKALTITRTSALRQAAAVGNAESMRLLIGAGADLPADAPASLTAALGTKCAACVDLVIGAVDQRAISASFIAMTRTGDMDAVRLLLQKGADVNARDGAGRTALMSAANTDAYPVDAVRLLLERGADVNVKGNAGDSAASLATFRGGPIADMLTRAGATAAPRPGVQADPVVPAASPVASARGAVQRALPLLQKADATFLKKSGCVSCHHDSLTAHTVALARKERFSVDEAQVAAHRSRMPPYLNGWRESALRGVGIPGGQDTVGYIMYGLIGASVPADTATDAMAYYLKGLQLADGHWRLAANRPPIESSEIEVTAVAMRVLQQYAPAPQRAEYARAVEAAAKWLATAKPVSTEDRAFQILGLAWTKGDRALIDRLAQDLVREQRPDGGWAPIGVSGMTSDAYATGEALTALHESGVVPVTAASYSKGVLYLLSTQLADGSWYVRTRAQPVQAYFESDFPHSRDQFVSAAATNWATMALIPAAAREPANRSN